MNFLKNAHIQLGPGEWSGFINDLGNGTYQLCYMVTEVGNYGLSVLMDNRHIPGSPFYLTIVEKQSIEIPKPPTRVSSGIRRATSPPASCFTLDSRRKTSQSKPSPRLSIPLPSVSSTETAVNNGKDASLSRSTHLSQRNSVMEEVCHKLVIDLMSRYFNRPTQCRSRANLKQIIRSTDSLWLLYRTPLWPSMRLITTTLPMMSLSYIRTHLPYLLPLKWLSQVLPSLR